MLKKRVSFTILEVIVVIFVISIIATITIPVVINDSKKAAFISSWSSEIKEAKYFFSLIKINNREDIQKAIENNNKKEIMNLYLNYSGLGSVQEIDPKSYVLRGLNNKIIDKKSPYHIQYLVQKNKKVLIGFSPDGSCPDGARICGKIFFDVNSKKGPNKLGIDVFGADFYDENLQVFGEDKELKKIKKDCSRRGTGAYCSIYYLKGGKFY